MQRSTRRVFVLGSGFSASMGLPTLRNLFDGLMSDAERPGESDKRQVLNALEFLYPHFAANTSHRAYPPFEEFLSLVSSAQDFPFFDEGYWEANRRSALRLLTDHLARRSEEAEASQLLSEFVDRLADGDVIITFNWDNLVERALFSHSKSVSFSGRASDRVAVLKLHGSLNWVSIPEGLALKEPDFVPLVAGKIVRTPDYRYYDVWNVLDQPPLIIPPVTSKNALVDPFFRQLWHEAFNSIVDASAVAFIGYSIPSDDLQARGLLTISWLTRSKTGSGVERFMLIDPNPEVCGRYASVVGTGIDFRQAYFSEEDLQFLFNTPLAPTRPTSD